MSLTESHWPVLTSRTTGPLPRLRNCHFVNSKETIQLRDGSCGFLLLHLATRLNDKLEALNGPVRDEWGYSYRKIPGTSVYSNHAGGCAMDFNATQHPRGVHGTWTPTQITAIDGWLRNIYDRMIDWGEFFNSTVDGMHFAIADTGGDIAPVQKVARGLLDSKRGKLVLAANPGLRAVVLS